MKRYQISHFIYFSIKFLLSLNTIFNLFLYHKFAITTIKPNTHLNISYHSFRIHIKSLKNFINPYQYFILYFLGSSLDIC